MDPERQAECLATFEDVHQQIRDVDWDARVHPPELSASDANALRAWTPL